MKIDDLIYQRSGNCYLENMDDEILLYNPENNSTLHLNESSALVWKMLDGMTPVIGIVDSLVEQYPEASDEIYGDVVDFLVKLDKEGAIEMAEPEE